MSRQKAILVIDQIIEDEATIDRALIQGAIKGRDEDFRRLIERYENLVWQLLNRIVPQEQDREELAQDVFLKVYFKLSTFKFESKFSTWLYTVTYRVAISHQRKAKPIFDEVKDQVDETDTGVDDDVKALIEGALASLSIDDRTIVSLYHQQECSIEEISTIVGKPDGTVKNQLFRVRKKLKQQLESQLGSEVI